MCRDGSILQSKLIRSGFLKRIGKGGLPGKRPSFLLSWLNASCTVLRNKKYKNLFHFGRNGYFDAKTEAGCEKTDCLDGGQAQ